MNRIEFIGHGLRKGDTVLHNGKPVRILGVSPWDVLVEGEDKAFAMVHYSELELIDRTNVETR